MGIFNKVNSNEKQLKIIVKTSADPKERMDAVCGITDQKFLFETAKNDNDFGVCKAAVEQLTNQKYLTVVGQDNAANDWRARKAAIGRMNDKVALRYIFDNENEITIKYAARDRLAELDSTSK